MRPPVAGVIKPLTSLRFFAALMVLGHHYFGFQAGYSGVTFFYVLSGYVLALNYPDLSTWEKRRAFWWRRFARIYPTYLLGLLIAIPVGGSLLVFVSNLLMVQSLVPSWSHWFGFNAPAWSLSDEATFYALFPLALFLITPRRLACALFLAIAFAAFWSVFVSTDPAESKTRFLFCIFPAMRSLEFAVGIVLARDNRSRVPPVAEIAALSLAAASIALFYLGIPAAFSLALMFVPAASLMIYVFSRSDGPIAKLLSHDWLVLLGDASFALYMTHWLWLHYLPGINRVLLTLVAIAGSVLVHLALREAN